LSEVPKENKEESGERDIKSERAKESVCEKAKEIEWRERDRQRERNKDRREG